jgi:hypothetical protein
MRLVGHLNRLRERVDAGRGWLNWLRWQNPPMPLTVCLAWSIENTGLCSFPRTQESRKHQTQESMTWALGPRLSGDERGNLERQRTASLCSFPRKQESRKRTEKGPPTPSATRIGTCPRKYRDTSSQAPASGRDRSATNPVRRIQPGSAGESAGRIQSR